MFFIGYLVVGEGFLRSLICEVWYLVVFLCKFIVDFMLVVVMMLWFDVVFLFNFFFIWVILVL